MRQNTQLSAVFNYAVTFYGLSPNPVRAAGPLGKRSAEGMQFWTPEEFKRIGELLALSLSLILILRGASCVEAVPATML